MPDIPASLRELWDASGPVLRHRLLRDVVGHDESYVETMSMGLDLLRLPDVRQILESQVNGAWGDFRTTEIAAHRLCELGLESHRALEQLRELVLQPTLFKEDLIWEFEQAGLDAEGNKHARRIIRDKSVHLVCRMLRDEDELMRTFLEQILAEWERYLSAAAKDEYVPYPTADGYAAVCRYPWDDDSFPRIADVVKRMTLHVEATPPPSTFPRLLAPFLFRLFDKWQYIEQPPRMLYDLELTARLGVARDLDFSAWMLEEMEARQDADGFFRFPDAGEIQSSWYFPLEKENPDEFHLEYTFRAELIFKLLAYDL